jgi:hypothetical protein
MLSKITYEHVDMTLYMFIYKDVSMHKYKYVKEGFHQKFKTSDKLQFCLYNQPFISFFSKTVPNFSGSISGPELTHPEASTSPSGSQYYTIRCPVIHHPGPVLHHP